MPSIEFTSLPNADTLGDQSFDVQIEVENSLDPVAVTIEALSSARYSNNFLSFTTVESEYSSATTDTFTIDADIPEQAPYKLRVVGTFELSSGEEVRQATKTVSADTESEPDPVVTRAAEIDVTPRIGPVEPIVMEAEYQLPWQRESNQTACGQTIQRQNGDLDWRIVFRGVVTLSQLDALRDLRSSSGEVETRTAAFGVKVVTFDELRVTRADEESVGEVNGVTEPLYAFQLQTKELEDDEGLFGS